MDRFLEVLSHALRSPLRPVLMSVAAMEQDRSLPEPLREELAMVRRNIDLEVRLIDDLLDLSRVRNGKLRINPTPTNVHKLLGHVHTICADDINSKRLNVSYDLAATDEVVQGDPARLQQVFWNLLKNAVKFTPDGGTIVVSTRNPSPDSIEVRFADRGVGIPPEVLPRLFQAFEQGDLTDTRQFGGLGLGLAISKAIVDMHGGKISAQSDGTGMGACFIVSFPLVKDTMDQTPVESPTNDAQPRRLRLLLVEDHADTARVLARLLQLKGYEVKTAHSVAEALSTVAAEPFDVLISDIGLPDADGYELMQKVRASSQSLKGIAMSGYGMDEDLQKSREAGFSEHVVKPVNVSQLEEALRRVVGSD
jgi:CheY-like chemotaxis protein